MVLTKLFIDGEWTETSEKYELKSPYNNEVIAEVNTASEEQIEGAIKAASQATTVMKNLTVYERSIILEKAVEILKEETEKVAKIIALESAKPIKYALTEVERTIETYKFAAEETKRLDGETVSINASKFGKGKFGYTIREPLGIIAAITPFNFPLNLVAHKLGPAIASGNTVILKPASQTPLSALYIADVFERAGLPKGALNVVIGSGAIVGDRLVEDQRISMVTFTGSPEVGKGIKTKAGLKKVSLELGSNAALIVDKDICIEKIIDKCVAGAFSNQGQVCISLQRMYVHKDIYDEFVYQFVERTKNLIIGNPLDVNTDISALISSKEISRVSDWIAEAQNSDAEVILGGTTEGNVLHPTVILGSSDNLKVICEEVFAPIVNIIKINSFEEGIEKTNQSKYGLQAGLFSNNQQNIVKAIRNLQVGGVIVNDIPTFRVDNMPYGGVKESGNAREGIKYAIQEMTELKLVVINEEGCI